MPITGPQVAPQSLNFYGRSRSALRKFNYARRLRAIKTDSDAALIARAAAGDDVAFARLIWRYKEYANSVIRRHVECPADAEDIWQEALLSLWRHLRHYNPDWSFKQWLNIVILNKCRDAWRRSAVRQRRMAALAMVPSCVAPPDTYLIRDEALARLHSSIAELSPNQTMALLLTVLGGKSQREAAKLVGVTEKTIETRVYRAKLKLAGVVRVSDLEDLLGAE